MKYNSYAVYAETLEQAQILVSKQKKYFPEVRRLIPNPYKTYRFSFDNSINPTGCWVGYHDYTEDRANKVEKMFTFLEWEEYIKQENNMEKRIVGYKTKSGVDPKGLKNYTYIWNTNIEIYGWMFAESSVISNDLKSQGLLDILFEPVYKEIINEVRINVGLPSITLSISVNGNIDIVDYPYTIVGINEPVTIEKLKKLVVPSGRTIGGFNIVHTSFRIGCEKEGLNITAEEIDKIIKLYKDTFLSK